MAASVHLDRCKWLGIQNSTVQLAKRPKKPLGVRISNEGLVCLTDRSRKTRRLYSDRRFHRSFVSISIAKLHLNVFMLLASLFLLLKTETGSRTSIQVGSLKIAVNFSSDGAFDSPLSFRCFSFSEP